MVTVKYVPTGRVYTVYTNFAPHIIYNIDGISIDALRNAESIIIDRYRHTPRHYTLHIKSIYKRVHVVKKYCRNDVEIIVVIPDSLNIEYYLAQIPVLTNAFRGKGLKTAVVMHNDKYLDKYLELDVDMYCITSRSCRDYLSIRNIVARLKCKRVHILSPSKKLIHYLVQFPQLEFTFDTSVRTIRRVEDIEDWLGRDFKLTSK